MRITLNGLFWPMPSVGSGQYLHELLPALRRLAPDDEFTLAMVGDAPTHAAARAIPWRPPLGRGADNDLAKTWFEQVVFPRLARDADLAHVPYFAPPLRPSAPTVVTVHDIIPLVLPAYRGSALARLYFRLAATALPRAHHVIADSEHSRQDILARFGIPPQRVTTVYLAAAERFRPASPDAIRRARRRYGLPDEYILYMGGYDVRKDVATLLAAYRLLQQGGARTALVCAGGLPRQGSAVTPDPRRQAETLGVTVHFPGFIAAEDQPALLSGARAFVFPSRYEGFGLPPLEALACGAPTVVADASSLPEVVGDAALLFPAGAAHALADTLSRLLGDAALQDDLRARGPLRAAQFSWERAARETRTVYTGSESSPGARRRRPSPPTQKEPAHV
ncbi:MAG: glycosyltransferase family 1 protein [Anaerolineae bacterium]